jgi:putative heme-binding domain-containing protein
LLPDQAPEDYVVVLEDRGGTGHADASHVFVSGLKVPTGLIPGDGGAYIGQGGQLYHFKDTKGDGRADQQRVLFTGFGNQDTHHTLNTFAWGPDGYLYFNQGLFLTSNVETPRGLRHMQGGCVWQLRPESLDLEVYDRTILHNNTWGHVWDNWGRSILSSAWVNDLNVGVADTPLNDSNEPDFVPPIKMTRIGGERHSGLAIVTGRHFPEDWQNNLITGGFQSQRVYRFALQDDGQHLTTKELTPLIISHHQKFRPIDMKIGPDGALYICDWYNQIIQHNQVNFRDPRRDHEHGRIWRITCKGRPLVQRPILVGAPIVDVLNHLKDPEQWARLAAKRVLAERDHREVLAALAPWVSSIRRRDPAAEHDLLEALWTYQTLDVVEPTLLARLLRAKDARVRAAATTVLGLWSDRIPDPARLIAIQADDENLHVRLEAVLAAQRVPAANSLEAAFHALDHPVDEVLDFELRKAALVLKPYWYPEFAAGKAVLGDNVKRLAFALSAARVADAVPRLLEFYRSGKITKENQVDLLSNIAALGTPDQLAIVFDAVAGAETLSTQQRATVLNALARAARDRKAVPKSDPAPIAQLILRDDALGVAAIGAVGAWKLEPLRPALNRINLTSSEVVRRAAIAALVELGGQASIEHLASLCASDQPYPVRVDAVAGLATLDLSRAATLAAQLFRDPPPPGGDPAAAFAAFLHRTDGDEALTKALAVNRPAPEVAKIGISEMNAAGVSFPRLTRELRQVTDVTSHERHLSPELQQKLVHLAQAQGDPSRGEKLFRSATLGCMQCHAIAGAGGSVAPDLAGIGSSAQPDFLVEHLILPTKSVKDGFISFQVVTKDGEGVSGVRVRENAQELVLKDATHDEIVIPKAAIKKQKEIGTLMPVGLADGLSDNEFADLVRFLMELGKPGPFAVGQAAVQRQWRALAVLPEYLPLLDVESCGRALESDAHLPWSRAYSNVSGDLPIAEVAIGAERHISVLRCGISVTVPGKLALLLNDAHGVRVWIDSKPIPVENKLLLEMSPGAHTLDFWVDTVERRTPTLRCEMLETPESTARARWASNR